MANSVNKWLFILLALITCSTGVKAQSDCPPNIDFEAGNFTNWKCYTGTNAGTTRTWNNTTSPVAGRHELITNTIAVDPICGIPLMAPNGGVYSVKLGNSQTGAEMERLSYTFTVPAGSTNYSLIYRYAVVLQDPNHNYLYEQPFFSVIAYDSLTGLAIACDSSLYIASGTLPGFIETGPNTNIWYKEWTTTTLKLNGMAGRTVRVEFTTGDCSQRGHYGYGYLDLSCGLFRAISANCNGSPTTPLLAPPGFQTYTWYNSNYATVIGTGQTVIINTPPTAEEFHVVLIPYSGYGCPDTLTTQVMFSNLSVNATPDSVNLCSGVAAQLNVTQVGNAPPFSYSWAPAQGLSCAFCPNPTAAPLINTDYVVSVTDSIGCTITDTVKVITVLGVTETHTNVTCYGRADGTASLAVTGGVPPYTYSWNTTPAQSAATATNLGPGIYTIIIRDATGCARSKTVVITQPPPLNLQTTSVNIRCAGVETGSVSAMVSGGTTPYNYWWNTTPVQTTATATNLQAGTYVCTVTDQNGCSKTDTARISESNPLSVSTAVQRRSCPGELNSEVVALSLGGSPPIRYSWNTTPVRTTPTLNNIGAGTYIITVQDSVGCMGKDTVIVTDFTPPLVLAGDNPEICAGDSVTLIASGAQAYSWSPPANLSCIACVRTVARPASTTSYNVIGKDANGCADTGYVTVNVIERVPVSVDSGVRICYGDQIMLGATGGTYYDWSPASSLEGPFLPNPVARPESTTVYSVIITENRCFKDTLQQKVTVMPLPLIDIMDGFNGVPGATVQLTTTTERANSITWAPPRGLSCYDCFNPVATLEKTIVYVAIVTDSIGCKARDTIRIIVGCDASAFYMANTFTPNNDGKNDYFYPQALGANKINRFMIYNRWGEVVFSATDIPVNVPERGWDGTFKGKEVPPDAFVYVVEALCPDGGGPILLKGDVTLMR